MQGKNSFSVYNAPTVDQSETYERQSPQNGHISVSAQGGYADVWAGGAKQTSRRYSHIWDDACTHTNPAILPLLVQNVLMLGLGGGGALPSIYKAFPNATIHAVEYDKEMIDIARQLQLQAPYAFPTIYEGDAAAVVPTLPTMFEVILVDIFNGIEPSSLLLDTTFIESLRSVLAKDGTVIANVCLHKGHIAAMETLFGHTQTWTYDQNYFGAFWDTH